MGVYFSKVDRVHSAFDDVITSTVYRNIRDDILVYDVYLENIATYWFLLIKANVEGSTFPYINLQITTDQWLWKIIPLVKVLQPANVERPDHTANLPWAFGAMLQRAIILRCGENTTPIGSIRTSIATICQTAE